MVASGRYELVGPLATGGMAEVLLARSSGPQGFERLFAIKRVLPERAQDPESVRMLIDEARNAATLSHKHIVQVFDIELRDGVLFYAMEYLHGQTLAAVLTRGGKLPLDVSLAICIAVADGLHHAHGRPSPIVHRDVAPSNVMITYDGNVKLIDFGIAKAANNLSNTVFGTFKGRLGYSSPEQVRCEPIDRRTDVYSLAIMLYELTTGRSALTADDEPQMIERMASAQIRPPRQLDPAYPADLEAIVMKGLARDRERRYATAADLQRDLDAFARRAGLNLSDRTLARLMTQLFAAELEPWERARETGLSLNEHVLRETLRTKPPGTPTAWGAHDSLDERTTVPRASRRRRSRVRARPRWAVPIAIVAALFGAAYLVTRLVMG